MKHFMKMIAIVFSIMTPLSAHAAYILSLGASRKQRDHAWKQAVAQSTWLLIWHFPGSGFDLALFDPDLTIIIVKPGSSAISPDVY